MNILRFVAITAALSSLSGCTYYSEQQVNDQLTQFNDLDLPQLISLLGVPSRQYELDGKTFVEWKKQDHSDSQSSVSIGTSSGGRGWFGALGMSFPLDGEDDICVFRATTDQNRQSVSDLNWRGNTNYCGEILAKLNPKNENQ